jgi:3-oxoacyl-[acyl-carrier protein] reductase
MYQEAVRAFGKVDILVNNAAIFASVPLDHEGLDVTVEHFDRVLHVNVTGTWLCCRAVIPGMQSRRYGKIINISSGTAFKGTGATAVQYVASKAAILGLTRALARNYGPDGIRVNTVAPGATTHEAMQIGPQLGLANRALQIEEKPTDLVGTIAFLASHDSDFITGQTIVVDGGSHMH